MEVRQHGVEGRFVVTARCQLVLQVLEDALVEGHHLVGDCGVHSHHLVFQYI